MLCAVLLLRLEIHAGHAFRRHNGGNFPDRGCLRSNIRKALKATACCQPIDDEKAGRIYGLGYLVAWDVPFGTDRPRALFRVFGCLRKDLGGDSDDHFYCGGSSLEVHLSNDRDDPARMVLAEHNSVFERVPEKETKPCGFCRFP